MKEIEICLNVPPESWLGIVNFLGDREPNYIHSIYDCYVDENNRARFIAAVPSDEKCELTTKSGEKGSGVRSESVSFVKPSCYRFFEGISPLKVRKERREYKNDEFTLSIDRVEEPLQHVRVEFEFSNEDAYEKFLRLVEKHDLVRCQFNTWNFHKRKIGIAGGPSSGKTTVAKTLSIEMNKRFGANTLDVVEYATTFLQKQKRLPTIPDQLLIYMKQTEREEVISEVADLVFSDCPTFLPYVYAKRMMKGVEATPFTDFMLGSLYKRAIQSIDCYENLYLLETKKYTENRIRYHNLEESLKIYSEIGDFIKEHGRKICTCYNYDGVEAIMSDILCFNELEKLAAFFDEVM